MRADRLKQRREERGLTQAELGARLKIEAQAVYRYEKGQSDPSADTLGRMAKELEVTADWLIGLVDDQNERLSEADLSPAERKLIDALRKGLLIEALETTTELAKLNDQSNIPGAKPATNG
jgi:Predicted transcriptional regulator